MFDFPSTLVIRHRLENLKKCSLRGLETRSDFVFLTYPLSEFPNLNNLIILTLDAPVLTPEDASHGLLIIDATWRYAGKMLKSIENQSSSFIYRSLPAHYRTAYPRRQNDCPDPQRGLASIEAIYLSFHILQRDTSGLLDCYHWKKEFLNLNNLETQHR